MTSTAVGAGVLLSIVLATGLLALTPRLLRRLDLYDIPTARSSHDRPVLRGAGVAVATTVVLVLIGVSAGAAGPDGAALRAVALAVAAFAVLGFVEDRRGLGVGTRLRWQGGLAVLAAGALAAALSAWWWWLPAALLVAVYVNVANFMDGINSISAVHGAVAGSGLAVVGALEDQGWLVVTGLVGAGAFAAFLPWNGLGRTTFFLGDAGSYTLGGFVSTCAAGAVMAGVPPWPVLSVLSVYLLDVGLTLVRRIRAGEDVTRPHREHVYQRLTSTRLLGHFPTGVLVGCCTLVVTAAGWGGAVANRVDMAVLCATGQGVVLAGYAALPRVLAVRRPAADREVGPAAGGAPPGTC
ncbi:MraY family glycosyltransferase [Blastococcus deserti]|uniref:UDP-N-acetylmuramyl pentapeptide phosphotransferase/UDP-N-acetylglucosamine-1-phosphate transferase n=1 Tax=Blastococcus deserti TaxID=2259033 RepID=A0ABW4XBE4_9ACTN